MYLDPSFGGMLIQIVVALVAVSGATVFAMRRKIKAMFSKRKSGGKEAVNTGDIHDIHDDQDGVVDMLSDDKESDE